MSGDNPLSYPNLLRAVAAMQEDIRILKRRRHATGATNVDELDDAEAKYLHATDAPKLDQALRWDATRDVPKFGGLATFSDPTVVDDYFTASVTGAGTFGLTEFLVDTDWDITRPCLATATIIFDGGYNPVAVSPPTTPATYIADPIIGASLTDRGTGYVTTPGSTYEACGGRMSLDGRGSYTLTLSWLLLRGRPKVNVSLIVSSDQYGGLTGTKDILVVTRCTRL